MTNTQKEIAIPIYILSARIEESHALKNVTRIEEVQEDI